MIKVLIEGKHDNTYKEGHYEIDPLTSSVTLIRTKNSNILCDTGSFAFREELIEKLAQEGLKPEELDTILITHCHLDHISNNTVFLNAKLYEEHAVEDLKTGKTIVYYGDKDYPDKYLPEEIDFFPTPGHFSGHMGVGYEYEGKYYIIAGDIIRETVIRGEGKSVYGVTQEHYESIKNLFNKADIIIPGHGPVIQGKLFDELKNIVFNELAQRHNLTP